ncbi:hypothetical protein V6N13_098406 [Hibiscus sabdariffa]
MEPILPPMFRRLPGRPHKKRKMEADEAPPMTGKVSKRGIGILGYFVKNVEGVDIILEHARERLVLIRKDLEKHPVLLQQELLEFQNYQPGPRTTPTSQATTTQTPSSTSTEPTQPNVFRWMPITTVRTSQESSISHSSPSPTPIPTQPSHPNVFRWMSTPGVPLSQDNCGNHFSPTPTPTPIPTPKPLSQDNYGSQSSPRIDP